MRRDGNERLPNHFEVSRRTLQDDRPGLLQWTAELRWHVIAHVVYKPFQNSVLHDTKKRQWTVNNAAYINATKLKEKK
jgi:hypothetical protein